MNAQMINIEMPQPVGIEVNCVGDVVQIQSSEQGWVYKGYEIKPSYDEHLGLCYLLSGYIYSKQENQKAIDLVKKSIQLVPKKMHFLATDVYLIVKAYIYETQISGIPRMLQTRDLDQFSISYSLSTTEALFVAGQYYKLASQQLKSQKLSLWCQERQKCCQEKVFQTGIYSIYEQAPTLAFMLTKKLQDEESKAYLQNLIQLKMKENK